MEFKRGDTITHYLNIPEDMYTPGMTVYFMAKPAPDDDSTDSKAEISKTFSGSPVVDNGVARFTLPFDPSDTNQIKLNGKSKIKLRGEFELRANGEVKTLPDNDEYIEVIVYADIRRNGNV